MGEMAAAALWFVAGYLVASVPIGLLVGRLTGIDIRRYGTGNIGASNMLRNAGLVPAAVVAVGSFGQGLLPAWLAGTARAAPLAVGAAAIGSVAGYAWSVWLAFRGGRAVGTATGALTALAPLGLVPLLALYAAGGLLRQPAPGVLLGLVAYLAYIRLTGQPTVLVAAAALVVVIVVLKRLDGVQDDLRTDGGRHAEMLWDRLLFDRRPGQRLVGPND
jgi:glycerol-3-phosphate acyltransferase PlsY